MTRPLPALLLFAAAIATGSRTANDPPSIGLRQGLLGGHPSVTLALVRATGELDGTVVLRIITRDSGQPHTAEREPHIVIRPRCDQKSLSFQLKSIDGSSGPMNFTVRLASAGKANTLCENCGPDAPEAESAKLR